VVFEVVDRDVAGEVFHSQENRVGKIPAAQVEALLDELAQLDPLVERLRLPARL